MTAQNREELTFHSICSFLNDAEVQFKQMTHAPTRTSIESARERGESLSTGAKALLLKTGEEFRLVVVSAHHKLDSGKLKKELGVKRIRFATSDELNELTGLNPGGVPPFGRPILPFDLYADLAVGCDGRIAFNAGLLTRSIIMSTDDWIAVAKPRLLLCADSTKAP